MELFEYIKSQLPQMPNVQIMKDLGASDELVEYVKESPENTNLNVMGSITNSDGGQAEVWLVGNEYFDDDGARIFTLSNVDTIDHIMVLFDNSESYRVYLDGTELTFLEQRESNVAWLDGETIESSTKVVEISNDDTAIAIYPNLSIAPTSVEVSVKANGHGSDTVTITFDPCNYEIETPSPITANKGETIILPIVNDETIYAWGENSNGSGKKWKQGAEYTATKNITLYFVNDR